MRRSEEGEQVRPQKGEMEESDRELAMLLYGQLRDRKDLTEVEEWRKQERSIG